MQRMHVPLLDGRICGGQRLPEHMSAEDPAVTRVATLATKQVHLEGLETQDLQDVGKEGVHRG